jgi:hypothetical protein
MARPAESLVLVLMLAAAGCPATPSGTPVDGCPGCKGRADAGPRGVGAPGDAGASDAGPDAGPTDAGPDAGAIDAGQPDSGPLTGQVCPAGSVLFSGSIEDLCQTQIAGQQVPLDGVQIATLPPYSATMSSDGGLYVACLPPGEPVTLQFTKPSYVPGYLAEVALTAPLPVPVPFPFPLFCNALLGSYFQEVPSLNTKLGAVYILVLGAAGDHPCGLTDYSGWSFTATLVDGGLGDGGPWPTGYIDPSETLELAPTTFWNGQAMAFNIDPAAQYVAVHGGNPDAGTDCLPINAELGFTGRSYVAAGAFSLDLWVLP